MTETMDFRAAIKSGVFSLVVHIPDGMREELETWCNVNIRRNFAMLCRDDLTHDIAYRRTGRDKRVIAKFCLDHGYIVFFTEQAAQTFFDYFHKD